MGKDVVWKGNKSERNAFMKKRRGETATKFRDMRRLDSSSSTVDRHATTSLTDMSRMTDGASMYGRAARSTTLWDEAAGGRTTYCKCNGDRSGAVDVWQGGAEKTENRSF